ncbi:outer membrane protein assembly factor BamA [Maritimibacter alexandrii]|jgi:outer membrane protein insertion porin family|uniref:outer membrane protein assembly factor BamA n=1 Tax=Maritimibacter alexandrii TaxID=2570355 RepID=UPI001108C741|nr:outer membrane protein assembly factor BamA [Maritimibacter alexandrii]
MTYNEQRAARAKGLRQSVFAPAATAVFFGVSGASLIVPSAALAQSYNFSSVQIVGTEKIEAATILAYLGFGKNETVSAAQLNDAYQRLQGSGLFDTVRLQPSGRTLVVRVQEQAFISRINIEGNRREDDEDLIAIIQSRPRQVFSPAVAERDAQVIAEYYAQKGRLAADVTPRIIRRTNGRVDLVFEVIEGRVSEIERLSFSGNRSFADSRLRRVLTSKQAGLLRAFVQSDTYDPGRIEFDKQVLTDFYNSRGFVDFRAEAVAAEAGSSRDGYQVTFKITEGQQFSVGQVNTISEVDGVDTAEFERAARLRQGGVYNPSDVDNAIARMERLAAQKGLNFITVEPRIVRNEREGTLDVTLAITRGPRVIVERIDIEGNQTTLDRVVRSEFRTVEGDPFNPREIRRAAERIRALGYFANVDVQAREGSASDRVVVDVDVEEQGTGSLSFGASYSTASGFGLNASFSESNFLGRGQYISAEFNWGVAVRNYSFSFAEPRLLGRDLELGINAFYYDTLASANANYDTTRLLVEPYLEFPISPSSRVAVKAGVRGSNIANVDPASSAVLMAEAGRGWQIGGHAGLTYTFDSAISGLDDMSRFFLEIDTEVGGLGADNQYLKATALARAQTRIMNDEVTLRAEVEGGALYSIGGAGARVTDRFTLGPEKVRGFRFNGTGPRDLTVANTDALGGNYFVAARVEAQFPLGLPEEYGISGGVFADVGSLWGLDNTLGGTIDDAFYLRSSVGASLFWDTPIGPLRFNYSIPVVKQGYDREGRFEVTIQTQF